MSKEKTLDDHLRKMSELCKKMELAAHFKNWKFVEKHLNQLIELSADAKVEVLAKLRE